MHTGTSIVKRVSQCLYRGEVLYLAQALARLNGRMHQLTSPAAGCSPQCPYKANDSARFRPPPSLHLISISTMAAGPLPPNDGVSPLPVVVVVPDLVADNSPALDRSNALLPRL